MLGHVIAHELGHNSHSPSGIMSANWQRDSQIVPIRAGIAVQIGGSRAYSQEYFGKAPFTQRGRCPVVGATLPSSLHEGGAATREDIARLVINIAPYFGSLTTLPRTPLRIICPQSRPSEHRTSKASIFSLFQPEPRARTIMVSVNSDLHDCFLGRFTNWLWRDSYPETSRQIDVLRSPGTL
jgi:hypothetical protein